jgi:hypothetical protein
LRSTVTGSTRGQKTLAAIRRIDEEELATYDIAKANSLFARFAKNGTWVCPALINSRARASLDDDRFTNDPRLKYLPRAVRADWDPANDFRLAAISDADYTFLRRALPKKLEIVRAMHMAGVRFLAGTDTLNPFVFPGFSLHDELALLVEAGLTSLQAVQAGRRPVPDSPRDRQSGSGGEPARTADGGRTTGPSRLPIYGNGTGGRLMVGRCTRVAAAGLKADR